MSLGTRRRDVHRFVGRRAELALLAECARRAGPGAPSVAVVEGPAGIGKTSLVDHFVEDTTAGGELGRLLPGVSLVHLRTPVGNAGDLLGRLGAVRARGPVAVVVDDLPWADRLSAEAVAFGLGRLGGDVALVIVACRDGDLALRLLGLDERSGRVTRIGLSGLREAEVAELAAGYVGRQPSGDAARWLSRCTAGHPLHLRALLAGGDGRVKAAADGPEPPSLGSTIEAWLARQSAATRALLESLAVLDTRLPLARLAQLAGVADPATAVEPALAAELVDWWPDDPSSPVALRHPLHRQALYSALPPTRRARLHAAAVRFVDHRSGWAHRVAAATNTDPGLAAELEAEAEREARRGDYETAADYLLWSARLSAERAEYERRLLTGCLQSLRDYRTGWTARVAEEVEGCAPTPLRACTKGVLALLRDKEFARADTLLRQAIAGLTGTPELEWVLGTAAAFLAALHLWRGHGRETVDAAELALSVAALDARTRDATRMVRAIGRSRVHGLAAAERDLGHLPEAAVDVNRSDIESLAGRGAIRTMRGDLTGALADLTTVVRLQRAGARCTMGHASFSYLATVQYLLGAWDDAELTAHQGLALVEGSEQAFHRCLARLAAVLVPASRGEKDAAEKHARAAAVEATMLGTPQDARYAAIAGAVRAQAVADWPRMLRALRSVRGLPGDTVTGTHVWWQVWWRPLLAEALIGDDRTAEAARELRPLTEISETVPYLRVVAARLDGLLRQRTGDRAGARARLELAARTREEHDESPLHRGMLEEALGRLLVEDGSTATGAGWLRSAHRRYQRLRAAPFAGRCAAELRRADGRDPAGDAPALSAREHEVARLAGCGLTNREIAAELFVSGKTVEYHLANVFRKLGITGRRQLRGRFHPLADAD
ncbi:LuxR C-terminal-related transcriptional regulator [Amycolatopsis sp. NPDC051128]|uniref:helix-turn-helix transcriptional regulator n=1 Tax=Amycolatopsis sp. NPDC051128 TaxID=3155412 RepID=UPI0034335F1A